MGQDFISRIAISLPVFLVAIVFHEYAHARMAKFFGDDTAERSGRLTLNPAVHYDLVGTIIFPVIGAMIGGVMFGWAKPVPVDPRYFKNINKGIFWVSFAGPLANIILAILSALGLAIVATQVSPNFTFFQAFYEMAYSSLLINILLAVFNLIPFPPLDGSKMVSTFLNYENARKFEELGRYSFLFIIILWVTPIFSYLINPVIHFGRVMAGFFIQILG